MDAVDADAIKAAADATVSALPSVGGLVHAAGVSLPVPVDDLDVDSWGYVHGTYLVVDGGMTAVR